MLTFEEFKDIITHFIQYTDAHESLINVGINTDDSDFDDAFYSIKIIILNHFFSEDCVELINDFILEGDIKIQIKNSEEVQIIDTIDKLWDFINKYSNHFFKC